MLAGVHDGDLFADVDPRTLIQRLHEAAIYAESHPAMLPQIQGSVTVERLVTLATLERLERMSGNVPVRR